METLLHIALSNALAATVLALVAAAASLALRRPPLTRALWLLVLIKLLTPPLWHVNLGRLHVDRIAPHASAPKAVERPVHPPAAALAEAPPREIAGPIELPRGVIVVEPPVLGAASPKIDAADSAPQLRPAAAVASSAAVARNPWYLRNWPAAAAIVWALGAAVQLALVSVSIARLRKLARRAETADSQTRARAAALARSLGLRRCPRALFVGGPVSPMLCAIGLSPRLLLPAELWGRLDDRQRDTVLMHELAHLRRRDHWVRILEVFVAAAYWWHPVVWWARRALREATEQCCDAWVLAALPRSAPSYATALIEAIDFISTARPGLPALASGMGQFTDLRRRLVMIKRGTAAKALSWPAFAAVCTLGGLLLPLSPGFAQTAGNSAPPASNSNAQSAPDNPAPGTSAPAASQAESDPAAPAAQSAAEDQPRAGGADIAGAEPATSVEAAPSAASGTPDQPNAPAATPSARTVPDQPNAPAAIPGLPPTRSTPVMGGPPSGSTEALPEGAREKLLPEARQEVARLRMQLAQAEQRLARLEGRSVGPTPYGAVMSGSLSFGGGGGVVTLPPPPRPGAPNPAFGTIRGYGRPGITLQERNAAQRIGQAANDNEEQRLDALEAQVHEILSELRRMRHEQHQSPAAPDAPQPR